MKGFFFVCVFPRKNPRKIFILMVQSFVVFIKKKIIIFFEKVFPEKRGRGVEVALKPFKVTIRNYCGRGFLISTIFSS